ncbi:MAG: tetratricopeptide repeat protein [Candidatus Aminicenantes bacterium]|nr:tetratricopeptide repeat protein [Candidatus Aminicenantes bacterium]
MRKLNSVKIFKVCLLSVLFLVQLTVSALAQYREYHIFGLVVDTEKNPLPGVEIILKDQGTARSYRVKTNKSGKFVLSGLPHARYVVTVKKEGFETRTFEWDFSQPQERMQKVEIETIVLASSEKVKALALAKETQQSLAQAMEKIKQNDLEGALKQLSDLKAKFPDDPNVRYLTGVALGRLHRYEEAVVELTKVTELAPEFAPAYQQLGYCYQNLNDLDKALVFYKKSAELDPTNAATLYNLGLILFEQNKVDEALSYFEKAMASNPEDVEVLEMVARCYVNKGELVRAVEYLEKARSLSKDQEKKKMLDNFISALKSQIKK